MSSRRCGAHTPPGRMPAWNSLSENQKSLYARQMEVYAVYQENADRNMGRVLDELERMGTLDNTPVIWPGATTAPAWRARSPGRSTI